MNFLIIGSGGREHSICTFIKKSIKTDRIYCIPGNAGTDLIAQNTNIDLNNFHKIKNFINKNKIDIVIVGPEKPLVDGIVDYLEKNNIKVFVQIKLHLNLRGQRFLPKNYVTNIIFLLQNLEY